MQYHFFDKGTMSCTKMVHWSNERRWKPLTILSSRPKSFILFALESPVVKHIGWFPAAWFFTLESVRGFSKQCTLQPHLILFVWCFLLSIAFCLIRFFCTSKLWRLLWLLHYFVLHLVCAVLFLLAVEVTSWCNILTWQYTSGVEGLFWPSRDASGFSREIE